MNLAAGLALRGQKTLLIDCDPQGNATTGLGVEKAELRATLYEVLSNLVDDPDSKGGLLEAAIDVLPNLKLAPATLDLAGVEPILLNAVGKELILRDAIEPIRDSFDWVIIDAPPSLGILTVNILAAVDELLVPLQSEFYALEGLSHLMKTIEIVRRRINPRLRIGKVLLTMFDTRNRLSHEVANEVREAFGEKVSGVTIPRNVRLSEAPGFGEAAVVRFADSKGAQAYMALVDEVLKECVAR